MEKEKKTKKESIIFVFALLLVVISLVSVSASLGTFKQNSCVDIRVLSNCTSVNITEVNDGTTTYTINKIMNNLGGQTFNYTFCNTSRISTYSYSWNPICQDCAVVNCGNSFDITPNGFINSIGFYILVFLLSIGLIILGYYVEDYWVIILGSFALILFGLYIIIYGLVGMKDTAYTWGFGIITMMLGSYFAIRVAWETIGDVG